MAAKSKQQFEAYA